MSSHVGHDKQSFLAEWYIVQRLPGAFETSCGDTKLRVFPLADGNVRLLHQCKRTDGEGWQSLNAVLHYEGNGRYRASETALGLAGPIWVIWEDFTRNTLILAAPDGRFAWVLHKSPQIPEDKRAAAEDILAFNGYRVPAEARR